MSKIISIILIIVSAGLFFGYIDPTYTKIRALAVEKADYDRALNNSKALQAERDKFLDKFNHIAPSDTAKLAKVLPDNIDNVRLIIDIDEMAKTHGMRIRNFKADSSGQKETVGVDPSPYGTLTLAFSTTATYNTFLAFVRDLERSQRILNITDVKFAASDTNSLYDYGVTLKTYWLK